MSAKSGSDIPINWSDLRSHREAANRYLTGVSYSPQRVLEGSNKSLAGDLASHWAGSRSNEDTRAQTISILSIAKSIGGSDELLDEELNTALNVLRTGLMVALHVAEQYAIASGFAQLRERNASGVKLGGEQDVWAAKQETHAAITAYVLAYFVSWRFESKDEKKVTANVDFAGLPEPIPIGNQIRSIGAMLYHLGSYLKTAQTSTQAHKLTELFFAAVLKEMQARAGSLTYSDHFTDVCYKLADTQFVIRGFEAQTLGGGVVEFKRVEMQEVVGNQEAKRLVRRLSQFVMAYDTERRMNPLMELGAFPWIAILQGRPGTGKSMLLGVQQTMVKDFCDALGVPFELHPLPNAIVSSLQGESAVQYERWWSRISNPAAVVLAPVDDAESVYLDRREQSSSEGSKLIVQSHLRLTEGSTALNRGNVLQLHATNNAEMIDPAVFSRYMARVLVPGAQTRNDFLDQIRLWGDKLNKSTARTTIGLSFPNDYVYLSDQGFVPKDEMGHKVDKLIAFQNEGLVALWEQVEGKRLQPTSYDLYGTFFALLHEKFPGFTSRDVRNITTIVTSRLFGFDFPEEWLRAREALVAQDYDTKKKMILDAAFQFQRGLTMEEILLQETTHYVESTIAMLDSGRQHRIQKMVEDMREREEAVRLLKA